MRDKRPTWMFFLFLFCKIDASQKKVINYLPKMSRFTRFYSGKFRSRKNGNLARVKHLTNSTSVRNQPVCFLWSERSGQEWGSQRHSLMDDKYAKIKNEPNLVQSSQTNIVDKVRKKWRSRQDNLYVFCEANALVKSEDRDVTVHRPSTEVLVSNNCFHLFHLTFFSSRTIFYLFIQN